MIISKLAHYDRQIAEQIHQIQIPAYNVEAKLIGFYGIPQLSDKVESIIESEETFIGYKVKEKIIGFISYIHNRSEVEICRLVVHPFYFRQGIAKELLKYLLQNVSEDKRITVSTGAKNYPAIKLYQNAGFKQYDEAEVAEGIYLIFLEK
ncbi:GNAT family N-acetyltransferase [Oceanobacillus halophilus]|uniref:GNAT family N-acetyltransferase n=1 Tax=Oceanobacillus halophilus TaxID=930130 RepID=A0A495A2E1_9BACI|nr:GNAT family N-acetyltransferase [Oceanobacillus halophilus]RKQ33242.1 GNAT family N-acetyltransferase [Oceanobacillus halophilus]